MLEVETTFVQVPALLGTLAKGEQLAVVSLHANNINY